ncbi:amino acid ABC transporter permease [Desulfobacula sp.]|uniref:amino acid ABC transporter permease n=1 Tax=Desulfobacula sp. TaxID=2593537 RepID=UPI00261C7831|nr:amino acid ABC transporter permease [Desulfobacula sp.]
MVSDAAGKNSGAKKGLEKRVPVDANGRVVAVARRRWGEVVLTVIIGCLLLALAYSLMVNPNLHWNVVGEFFFAPAIMDGIKTTLLLTVFSQSIAVVLGIVIALMQQSYNQTIALSAKAYIWFFRGTPLLVQLVFWFNLALLFPTLGIGIPWKDFWWGIDTNRAISPFMAALLGLGLHEAGYMAEIVRGGLYSVGKGQMEAALSIGMTRGKAQQRIILPQIIRVIIPPTGNQLITMLKASSLVAVIGGGDLLTRTQSLYSQNYEVMALLIIASFWYLFLVSIASIGQYYLERSLAQDTPGYDPRPFWRRLGVNVLKPGRTV